MGPGIQAVLGTMACGSPPVLEPRDDSGTLPKLGTELESFLSLSVSNLIKAAAREGSEGSDFGKPRKNFSGASHSIRGATGLLRRKEVTEEEAER